MRFAAMMQDQLTFEDQEDLVRFRAAWEKVLEQLQKEFPTSVNERFFKPLVPLSYQEGTAVLGTPGAFVQEWVREKYLSKINKALNQEMGEEIRIELKVELREKPTSDTFQPVSTQAATGSTFELTKFKPIEKFRFETFVVGQSNRLGFAAAKAVAADPGSKYNPLFIYGASGLGKTHLLHSVAAAMLQRDPRYPVAYLTAQQFAEEFVYALQNNRIDQFRRAQRSIGVWLLDDIQFIAGKDKTQEEIFHTFNFLRDSGKQIVLCSDRPPRDLFLMDERLRSRFESGLVADIQPPDTELRCAILLSKAQHEAVPLDHEVAMCLAENVPGNVRILEGALTKLAAAASLEGKPITLELAQDIIDRYYRTDGMAKPGFTTILEAVSKHYKIPVEDIRGISRKAPIAHARHVAVYITRQITGDSWKHIGSQFGDRDHTSMMHAYQKISEMVSRDRDMSATVKMLIRHLYPEV